MTKLFVTLLVLDLVLRFILYDVILVNICAIVETLRQLFERSIRFISSLYVNSNHYYQNSCQLKRNDSQPEGAVKTSDAVIFQMASLNVFNWAAAGWKSADFEAQD